MHDSTMFGRALTPVELSNARYLDALHDVPHPSPASP
jgi:hypothetical protein